MKRIGRAGNVIFATICIVLTCALQPASAEILFVDDDAPPGGDGMSWETAFADLQIALDAAEDGDEIRVAGGTYRPAVPRQILQLLPVTYTVRSAVAIRGGFEGAGSDARDPARFLTVLSGDVEYSAVQCCALDPADCDLDACMTITCEFAPHCCDDEWDLICEALAEILCDDLCLVHVDGADHVVTVADIDGSVELDGLTITGGNAVHTFDEIGPHGGGVYVQNSNLRVTRCSFAHNRGRRRRSRECSTFDAHRLRLHRQSRSKRRRARSVQRDIE